MEPPRDVAIPVRHRTIVYGALLHVRHRPSGHSLRGGGEALPVGCTELDFPCKDTDLAAAADIAAYGTDHAKKLRG
jgi:hypothetical protein